MQGGKKMKTLTKKINEQYKKISDNTKLVLLTGLALATIYGAGKLNDHTSHKFAERNSINHQTYWFLKDCKSLHEKWGITAEGDGNWYFIGYNGRWKHELDIKDANNNGIYDTAVDVKTGRSKNFGDTKGYECGLKYE